MMQASFYRHLNYCILLALFPLFTFLHMSALNVLAKDLMLTFHITNAVIDLLGATYLYADAIMLLPAGILLDKYNTKQLALFGLSINLIGLFIFIKASNIKLALLGRIVAGLGHSFSLLSCFRLAKTLLPDNKQGFAMGLIFTLALSGGFLAQAPMASLIIHYGWIYSLYILLMFGVLILLNLWLILPKRLMQPTLIKNNNLLKNLKLVGKNSQNWFVASYSCLMSIPLMILGTLWGVEYLTSLHHLTTHQAAFATGLLFVGNIIGLPLTGYISDRFYHRKLIMQVGAVLTLVLLVIIYTNIFTEAYSLMLLFMLVGLCSGSLILSYPIIAEINPTHMTSTAMGFMSVLIVALTASLQVIFGIVQTYFSQYSFLVIITCIAISLMLSGIIKPKPVN